MDTENVSTEARENAEIKDNKFDCETLVEMKECFTMLDQTQQGKISGCLVVKALRALGQNPSCKDVHSLFVSANKKETDEINFDEFISIVSNFDFKNANEVIDELTEAFKVFDRQEVGLVNSCELRNWLEKSEEHMTPAQIDDLVKMSGGKKDDNTFNYIEFIKKVTTMDQT